MVLWGLYWGPIVSGNYHFSTYRQNPWFFSQQHWEPFGLICPPILSSLEGSLLTDMLHHHSCTQTLGRLIPSPYASPTQRLTRLNTKAYALKQLAHQRFHEKWII